ncbi:MAG TPA: RuBisCO large subunit C-terminal-like domain-containing protein [Roseiarcus sp.]|nr:RuBisCO large subunit C-terminal-like domain-containing protein [Roseiarcus sp.]
MSAQRLIVTYRIRGDAASIDERAKAIAVEQSVEAPLAAVRDPFIRAEIVGEVLRVAERAEGVFDVDIGLSAATIGGDAGQLMNMLFGNTSLHDDVALIDVVLPAAVIEAFGGPSQGLAGLRRRTRAERRALTASALKPQGLTPAALGELAHNLALGGLDFIKDDHGLADQKYSRFEARVMACADAVRKAVAETGHPTHYVPSLSGDRTTIERQIAFAKREGLDTFLIAPAVAGVSTLQALRLAHPTLAFIAHPTLTGARIAPDVYARLFRLFGADASIFPNYGGRFGYSESTCLEIAKALRDPWRSLAASAPAPAGGMDLARVPEMLRFYGGDVMLLIGGALLTAEKTELVRRTRQFVQAVVAHEYGAVDA